MSSLSRNVIANYVGNLWISVLLIGCIPFYISSLGVEAFGLVGIFTALQGIGTLFDCVSLTVQREIAGLSVQPDRSLHMRNLVRTAELLYWALSLITGLMLFVMAPAISHHWLSKTALPPDVVILAVELMGVTLALRFPNIFYSGGLQALQLQVLNNTLKVVMETIRSVGALICLKVIAPSIIVFFAWQAGTAAVATLVTGALLWSSLPSADAPARFRPEIVSSLWKLALSMAGASLLSVILLQGDKIFLSKLLPLEVFGYYSIAIVFATGLQQLMGPIFSAFFPRLTQCFASGDKAGLALTYHKASQLLAVAAFPMAAIICIFSREVLFLWTQDLAISQNASLALSLLIIGTMLNGLSSLPFFLQFAHGWTSLALAGNIVAVCVYFPLIYVLTARLGLPGAAAAWLVLNLLYVCISVQLMHRRILPGEKWSWYVVDVAIPLMTAMLTALIIHALLPATTSRAALLLQLVGASTLTLGLTTVSAPQIRTWILEKRRALLAYASPGS